MTEAAIMAAIKAGKTVALAEYRSLGEAGTISGETDKGVKYSFSRAKHNLEIAGQPFELSEKLPDGTKTDNYKSSFAKGQPVVVAFEIEPHTKLAGLYRVTGTVEALEAESKAK